jgi:hypothetical protein
MSVPRKYRHLGDFHKYYSGRSRAPVLTIVIGGNHEASNYLFELYHRGWLAPDIYYIGAAGVIRYGPWRIAGLSGITTRETIANFTTSGFRTIETASSQSTMFESMTCRNYCQ